MKNVRRLLVASALTLLAPGALPAADSKPINRVISIQDVETDDPTGYAIWIARNNEIAKARLGLETFMHVYTTVYDGQRTGLVRAVSSAESVSALAKIAAALENDPGIAENREHLRGVRKLGARVLYQTVRFDGIAKGAVVYRSEIVVTDEPAYLKALDQLRSLLDQAGLQDVKINAYRVLAGRSDHSHFVSINATSNERLAAFLDWSGTNPKAAEWLAASGKLRTVVSNGTGREITR